jgi:class 3 adenylate cyclase
VSTVFAHLGDTHSRDLYAPPMASALIGRRAELAWLRGRVDLALGGFAHLVIVEGESGIGKTRLAHDALEHARRRKAAVQRGRCYDHLDLPYLPLRDSLFAAMAQTLAAKNRTADVAVVDRARDAADEPLHDSPDEIQRERTRQLLVLTDLVLEHVRDAPTVVFVDDVDWADAATVDLLRHLLFRLDDEQVPMLVLATSRADPAARAAEGVARLRSEPRTAVVHLNPLTELEATEMLREREPGAPLDRAREVAAASGGNPLLVEALAHDAGANRLGPTPAHPIVAAIGRALDALSPEAGRAVLTVAVLGPDARHDLVLAIGETTDDAIIEALDAGVLVEDGTRLAFRHPVYAHTVYDRAPASVRRDLHREAAAILVEPRAIAHHLVAGGAVTDPDALARVRAAGNDALARGEWAEAARYYEAALAQPQPPEELADLHRRAGLSRRANLQLARAVTHFDAALELLGDGADAETRAELHLWRIRSAIGTHEMLDVVRDRGPLEALVDEVEADAPELAAEALVELSQSYWAEWRMRRATECAQRAMAIASANDDHSAYARATTTITVPQWTRYALEESLATLEDGIAHARAANDDSLLAGGPLFRAPLVLAWLGRFAEAEERALECCDIAERTQYPLELGLPLAALTQLAVARGRYDEAEQHAHRALLLQRLSGYHWAAGLYLPPLACAYVARRQFEQARATLATWSETADALGQASIDLYARWVTACERRLTVLGDPLPGFPPEPMVGADAWAALAVELAQREGATGDLAAARSLLEQVEERGGVLIGGTASLVARHLGVTHDLLGDEAAALATLERAAVIAESLGAVPELARVQTELAVIRLRRGEQRAAFALLDTAAATFRELDLEADAARVAELSGAAPLPTLEPIAPNTESIILFTDVVDSTRLTEELGASHYRARARQAEAAITGAITTNGGTIVTGINLGDGFIGMFPTVAGAIEAARRCTSDVPHTRLHLHVAVHQGEIIVDGDRIYGPAVNMAARVCGLSGPDEILVSEPVRAALEGEHGVRLVDRGEHELKGIAAPQRVYAVVTAEEPAASPA